MNLTVRFSRPDGCRAAFTMVEVLVASLIGAVILGGVMSTYIFSVRSFSAVSNYGEIQRNARQAGDFFARDMRAVSGISAYSSTNITVAIPTSFSNGSVLSNKTVSYWVGQQALYRYELKNGTATTTPLATNVNQITLTLYDSAGNATVSTSTAKGIVLSLGFRARTGSKTQSLDYVSARIDMRNKS